MEPWALVGSIPGWLLPEDAETLHELAGSTSGPILEVGTHRGKSAVLMASALRAAGGPARLYTIEVNRASIKAAAAEAAARDLAEVIVFVHGTLRAFVRAYPQLRPALTFVDGDHSRVGVERDLAVLRSLVPAEGVIVFHDFNDPQNDDPACQTVKVRPTVQSSWVAGECELQGVFGACGVFTRRTAPQQGGPPIAGLRRLDSIRDQYLHGLRYPAGRLLRRMRRPQPRKP